MPLIRLTTCSIFLAFFACAVSAAGTAAAQRSFAYGSGVLPPDPPPGWFAEGHSLEEWDWLRYDYSGTRGRMGLGASPAHPEGPGNFSSPGW
ncbi:MAG TPA: hypothetical protein VFG05_01695 [Methylocella sp.]|nr:hypothetical protein [Methylocella sp.]